MIKHKSGEMTTFFIGFNPHDPTLELLKRAVDRVPGMEQQDALEELLREAGNNAIVIIPNNVSVIFYKR